MSFVQVLHRSRQPLKRRQASATPAVPAERVREMLREIAFVLHATRVVGRRGKAERRLGGDQGVGPVLKAKPSARRADDVLLPG